jgi:HSP20 family molecular chaperone IbpA
MVDSGPQLIGGVIGMILFPRDLEELFFRFPQEPKPPIAFRFLDSELEDGISISMAVAGFKKEDINVYVEDKVLKIEGDNTERDIPEKFKAKFQRVFPAKSQLDVDKASVKLEDGILSVKVPIVLPEKSRKYLFGSAGK